MISTETLLSARTRIALGESPQCRYFPELMQATVDLLDFVLERKDGLEDSVADYSEWARLVARAIWRQTQHGPLSQNRGHGYWPISHALWDYLLQLDVFAEIIGPRFKTKVFHLCVRERESRLNRKLGKIRDRARRKKEARRWRAEMRSRT